MKYMKVQFFLHVLHVLHGENLSRFTCVAGKITLIGSANMNQRSFDLNYENNINLYDRKLTD